MTIRRCVIACGMMLFTFAAAGGVASAVIPPEWSMRIEPGAPIQITDAVADPEQRHPSLPVYAGCVSFVNRTNVPATRVAFAFWNDRHPAPGPKSLTTLVRYGTFSPGVVIRGVVGIDTLFGNNGANCSNVPAFSAPDDIVVQVTDVTFADGTTWTNPAAHRAAATGSPR